MMEEELIVNGRNVLKPVDLVKNKNEIETAQKTVPSQVPLNYFQEKIAYILDAPVIGKEANELVAQLQKCFTDINKRENVLFDNVNTIYRTVEAIHRDNIEGIISAIKSAQIAINEVEDTNKNLKETLDILQEFKERLEDNTQHLNDIDIIWDKTDALSSTIADLNNELQGKIKENSDKVSELLSFKTRLEKYKHIDDIDKMFDECQKLNNRIGDIESDGLNLRTRVDELSDKQNSLNTQFGDRLVELEDYRSHLDSIEHISDVDEGWEQLNNHNQTLNEIITRLDELSNRIETEHTDIKNKIEIQWYAIGGSFVALLIVIICNLFGVL